MAHLAGQRGNRRRTEGRVPAPELCRGRDSRSNLASSFLDIPVRRGFRCRCRSRHTRSQRHLCGLSQISVACRGVQSIPPGARKHRSRTGSHRREAGGRWRSGAPLVLAADVDNPTLGADPQRNNDFNYSNDPRGRQAPFGCHIRRMNPRDTKLTRLTDVNLHRLIRRGTTYGPPYDPNALSEADDEVPRGGLLPVH